jgi:histidine triad (HIT) family protein
MEDCVFCKIISGEIPSSKVYEDAEVVGFLDITPVNKGHTLIIPKKHSPNMLQDSAEDLHACINAIQKVALAIIRATGAEGINLMNNTNKAAGQAVFHTHFHLIPRFPGDGLKHWPQGHYDAGEAERIKEGIVSALR